MPLPKPLLTGTLHDYGIGALVEMSAPEPAVTSERRLMNLTLPPWQRPEVWSEDQKRRFVEGIFLGLGTGYYVVHASDWTLPDIRNRCRAGCSMGSSGSAPCGTSSPVRW